VLGTFATVIITADSDEAPLLLLKADSLLVYLDTQLGMFSETGQLHDLNTNHFISADTELGNLILRSDTLVRATGNSFDPSLGSLCVLWGFPSPSAVPDSSEIELALSFSHWSENVRIGVDTIFTDENTVMDFGAIAKGHAVDRTYELLREMGATECLVEVGGEVRCGSSTGRTWNIGIRHPREEGLAGILAITDGAVATSGDYECFFIQDNVRYCHLLDSKTGYPSQNAASATIIAEDCATADAMATAAAVAGPEGAELFPVAIYTAMIIITADENNNCEIHEFGDIPWAQ
jgi:thiamine biosynthesis lipoprotein